LAERGAFAYSVLITFAITAEKWIFGVDKPTAGARTAASLEAGFFVSTGRIFTW